MNKKNRCGAFADHYYIATTIRPTPLPSGTWNDQCLAVESFWQRSWKHKNKSSWQLDYIMTLGAPFEAEQVAL